jgi:hypothetical protein
MVSNKSLDVNKVIAALLHDASNAHGSVFNIRSCKLTILKVNKRLRKEGLGFLTKTLPRLGKALDRALTGETKLNARSLGFDTLGSSELPRFLGELFGEVFQPDGTLLPNPCSTSVGTLRLLLFAFYKYELPYNDEQEQQVISAFKKTESDLKTLSPRIQEIGERCDRIGYSRRHRNSPMAPEELVREARILLSNVFAFFDPKDIYPRHGPGVVATKQRLWEKYRWTNVSERITDLYPFDAYFMASLGHVCDKWHTIPSVTSVNLPARVLLVPKDSRGPRLISCEPVDNQWIQQGLGRAVVQLVERHPLTRENVRFTDQQPNQLGALLGSLTGGYATLDLKEASDRISVDLVRLLFPKHVYTYLESCRSLSTVLPDGTILELQKFAPMGSCLCFPILALTVWAILAAGAPDTDTRESIYVYGDDVIVKTAHAARAIEQLESFGLLVNRDKCCTSGFFRESCGADAFQGKCVTPVRFRTVWSSTPSPESYASWIAYANQLYDRKYFVTYDLIVSGLLAIYGSIPSEDMQLACLSLREVPDTAKPKRRRWNKNLQKFEYLVTELKSPVINKTLDGYSMLLRYFAESVVYPAERPTGLRSLTTLPHLRAPSSLSVSTYTSRRTSVLVRRWR